MKKRTKRIIKACVAKHGEQNRVAIVAALKWLEKKEPTWHLPEPMDKMAYIDAVISKIK